MPVSGTPQEKIHQEMGRFKRGQLHSGSDRGPIVKNRAQAVAIAMSVARKNKAAGGPSGAPPWYLRQEARGMVHTGAIKSPVAGRTDHLPMNVPAGSYVIPSSVVSHIGQDNTASGHARLDHMFSSGPFGAGLPKMGHGKGAPGAPHLPKFADGGAAHEGDHEAVPIMAAGGEYVVPPSVVRMLPTLIGEPPNLHQGHQLLDEWVKRTRAKHIKTLRSLPGPAK